MRINGCQDDVQAWLDRFLRPVRVGPSLTRPCKPLGMRSFKVGPDHDWFRQPDPARNSDAVSFFRVI